MISTHRCRSVAILLLINGIVLYGFLARYNDYLGHAEKMWGYLGTSDDPTCILDAAARVLATGTFAQFDGTYARVTGLAGYGLGLLAMAVGGLYPGYAWLRFWLVCIGSLIPLVGFIIVRAAFGSVIAGLGVAALLACEPLLITESKTIYHDVPTTVFAGLSLYYLYHLLREERFQPWRAMRLGLVSGLTILAKMSHLCLLAVIVGSVLFRRWTCPRWKNVGVALLATLFVLGLWVGRNSRICGAPILSSQSGFAFAASTGQAVWKPPGAGGEIATVGQEQRFNQAYVTQALRWIQRHPREYAHQVLKKIFNFWSRGPSPWWRWLLWGVPVSLGVGLLWGRSTLPAIVPCLLYLLCYTTTFGFVWPAVPTYYPPFVFLLILILALAFTVILEPLWRLLLRAATFMSVPPLAVRGTAVCLCLGIGLGPLTGAWRTMMAYHRRAAEERSFLAWVGTVLPSNAIIIKTDVGDPWEVQRYTHRPVVFNILYGMPWVVYKTPYGWRDYRQDYEPINHHPTAFRFDRQRDHGMVDAAVSLEPSACEAFRREGVRQLLTLWRARGRELFVLDTDARLLAETFLPLNAYALRGDELSVKFFQAFPQNPRRSLYRLLRHDDPRWVQFGPGMEEAVVWETVPSPRRQVTTVRFVGAFGRHPGMAKILVNGTYAMSFSLGSDSDGTWTEHGYHLTYQRQHAWWEMKGPQHSIGVFTLTVPVHVVTAGKPLTLSISPLLVSGDPECWFGLLDVPQGEGVATLIGASEVLRHMDDGQSGHMDIWIARSEPARF